MEYPTHLLEGTFAIASMLNGVLAIFAGLIAHFLDATLELGPIGA